MMLFLLLTALPLAASKTPAQLIKDYKDARFPGKGKALRALLAFSPSDLSKQDRDDVITILAILRAEESPLVAGTNLPAPWFIALLESQGPQPVIPSSMRAHHRDQVLIARALAERKAQQEKERVPASASATASKPVPPTSGRVPPPPPPLPKPTPTTGKVPPPLPPLPASKKPTPPGKGLDESGEKESAARLLLVSKEGTKHPISRAVAIRFSDLIKTALDADKDAPEVDIPPATRATLQGLIDIMNVFSKIDPASVDKWLKSHHLQENPSARKRAMLELHGPFVANIKTSLPDLMLAALYIGANDVLDVLLHAYPEKIARSVNDLDIQARYTPASELSGKLLKMHSSLQRFPIGLLKLLSQAYFLERGTDIDLYLGLIGKNKTFVPFDDLVAYEFFNAPLLEAAPQLAKDPNAVIENPLGEYAMTPPDDKGFTALSMLVESLGSETTNHFGGLKTIRGLLKLKGIDPNKGQAVRSPMLVSNEHVKKILKDAGASD